jgi:hypothetical protein
MITVCRGPSRAVRLTGDVGAPKCVLKKKSLRIGLLPIGIMKVPQTRIENIVEDYIIFTLDLNTSVLKEGIGLFASSPFHLRQLAIEEAVIAPFHVIRSRCI